MEYTTQLYIDGEYFRFSESIQILLYKQFFATLPE